MARRNYSRKRSRSRRGSSRRFSTALPMRQRVGRRM